ncbi:MAG: GAF domain-containing protein, partial [Pseudomonadota bacterium]
MDIPDELASQNLPERFFNLLDHLSLIKALSQIEIDAKGEEEIIRIALIELMRYQVLDSCSLFRLSAGSLDCVSGISMDEFHEKLSGASVEPLKVEQVMQFSRDEGIMGIAVRTGEMQYCNDCANSKEFKKASLNGKVPGSLICVPVKMGGEVLAILNASHSRKDFFEPWQQHGLSLFGSYLGQILHNHRLIHNLEQQVEERTRELRVALEESEHLKRRYQQLSTEDEL